MNRDSSIDYENAGGLPSVVLATFTPAEIESALMRLQRTVNAPALVRLAARYPAPDAVTCKALLISCEGGLGPIHYDSLDALNPAGFTLLELRRGVPLGHKTIVANATGEPVHRALAGWMDHGFFLIETPHAGIADGDIRAHYRYYRAYSAGSPAAGNPDLPVSGAATWSGAMAGLVLTNPDLAQPDTFVTGDATVTVTHRPEDASIVVGVEFSNIRNELTGAGLDNLRWDDLPLQEGSFGIDPVSAGAATVSQHPASRGISGRFYGSNHEEVGGLFGRREIMSYAGGGGRARVEVSGAFGARRD